MPEYALNQLTHAQLAKLALTSATAIAVAVDASVKLELYYLEGHFIELSYSLKAGTGSSANWRLYSANHYPDVPASTKYLTIYLDCLALPVC